MVSSIGGYNSINPFKAYNNILSRVQSVTPSASPYQPSVTQSPFSKFQDNFTSALKDVQKSYSSLKSASDPLSTSKTGNSFDKRSVDNGGSTAVTATAADKASLSSYTVGVSQVAKAQENTGTQLTASDNAVASGFTQGTNSFSVTTGGKTTNISVNVSAADSNKTALQNMAKAINDAKTGVTAKVIDSTSGGVTSSKIVLTSGKTGTDNTFSLTAGSGTALATSGAGAQTTAAQNASYTVNGVAATSQSNTINLDNNKLAVTLKGTTTSNVTLKVGNDTKGIADKVVDFAKKYNDTVKALQDNKDYVKGSLTSELTRFASDNRFDLSDMGITVKSDKTLEIDRSKLEKSLTDNYSSTKNMLNNLGSRTGQKADAVTRSSMSSLVNSSNYVSAERNNNQSRLLQQQMDQYQLSSNVFNYYTRFNGAGNLYDSFL